MREIMIKMCEISSLSLLKYIVYSSRTETHQVAVKIHVLLGTYMWSINRELAACSACKLKLDSAREYHSRDAYACA